MPDGITEGCDNELQQWSALLDWMDEVCNTLLQPEIQDAELAQDLLIALEASHKVFQLRPEYQRVIEMYMANTESLIRGHGVEPLLSPLTLPLHRWSLSDRERANRLILSFGMKLDVQEYPQEPEPGVATRPGLTSLTANLLPLRQYYPQLVYGMNDMDGVVPNDDTPIIE